MVVLLVFALPLVFFASISSSQKKGMAVVFFVIGLFIAIPALFLQGFVVGNFTVHAPQMLEQWMRFFMRYYLYPVLFGTVCLLPFFISLRGDLFTYLAPFFFGVFTTVFFGYTYEFIQMPVLMPFILPVAMYSAGLLFLQSLTFDKDSSAVLRVIGVVLFIAVGAVFATVLSLWFFQSSILMYGGITLITLILSVCSHLIMMGVTHFSRR